MRKISLIIVLQFYLSGLALAQSLKTPGTVYINDSMYMKATEVTVLEWIEFLANQHFDSSLFPSPTGLSPVMATIFDDLRKGSPRQYVRFEKKSTPAYDHHPLLIARPGPSLKAWLDSDSLYAGTDIPITGISFEQAMAYCAWREKVLNQGRTDPIRISLPDQSAYRALLPITDSLNDLQCARFNWADCSCTGKLKGKSAGSQGKTLLRATAYLPSAEGLYNLRGNAAEMTSTKGIAMGGSFRHKARASYPDRIQPYQQAESWLGFRYIVVPR